MVEALWSVEFVSSVKRFGAGVALLETQRVFGGDSQYFYVGSYKVEEGRVSAKITVTHYAGQPISIFGALKELNLELTGMAAHDQFELLGHLVEKPELEIAVRLTRRAELP